MYVDKYDAYMNECNDKKSFSIYEEKATDKLNRFLWKKNPRE